MRGPTLSTNSSAGKIRSSKTLKGTGDSESKNAFLRVSKRSLQGIYYSIFRLESEKTELQGSIQQLQTSVDSLTRELASTDSKLTQTKSNLSDLVS